MSVTARHFLVQADSPFAGADLWHCTPCYGSLNFYGGRAGCADHMKTRAHKLNIVHLYKRRRDAAQKDFEEVVALHASAILNPLEPL